MKKALFTLMILALCAGLYGQKISALTEATVVDNNSLMYIRAGSTGDLIKKITIGNIFKDRTLTGTVTIPSPFTLGATSVTTTGAQLNYSNTLTGNIQTQLNELVINVKSFGAVGNGSDNDATAINAALTAAAGGGTLYFPTGVYLTSGNHIVPDSNVVIMGSGNTIFKASGDNPFFVDELGGNKNITFRDLQFDRNNKETVSVIFSNSGSENLTIDNCVFYGSKLNPTGGQAGYIMALLLNGLNVSNCKFSSPFGSLAGGFHIYNNVRNIKIINNYFTQLQYGVWIDNFTAGCYNANITGNVFYYMKWFGMRLYGLTDGVISSNSMFGFTDAAAPLDGPTAVQVVRGERINIVGNKSYQGAIYVGKSYNINIIGNSVNNSKFSSIETNDYIDGEGTNGYTYNSSNRILIANNIVKSGGHSGIFASGKNHIIIGNVVDSCWTNGISIATADTISDFIVSNNILRDNGQGGLGSDPSGIRIGFDTDTGTYVNINITKNTIVDTKTTTPYIKYGINWDSPDIINSNDNGNTLRIKDEGAIYEHRYNEKAKVDRVAEIHTVVRTIGHPGHTTSNYSFTSVANSNAQEFDFGSVIPQGAKVLKVEIVCTQALAGTGTHEILFRVGNATTGQQFLADIECGDDYEVVNGLGATIEAVPMVFTGATHIWVGANPDANWDTYTAGKWTVFITYIDYLIR